MARIAVISGVPVFPTDAGNRSRILALTRAMRSLGHEVDFLHLVDRPLDDAARDAHRGEYGEGRFVELELTPRERRMYALGRELHGIRRHVLGWVDVDLGYYRALDEWCPRAWLRHVGAVHAERRYEAVIVEYVFHSRVLSVFGPEVLRIVDTHDRFADRHRAYVRAGVRYWYTVSPATEASALRRADVALAIQDEEAAIFRRDVGDRVDVVTVGHLLDVARPIRRHDGLGAVVVGSSNATNMRSVGRFLDEVLPRVREALPEFRLHLVGAICGHVPDRPGLVRRGFVEDVRDVFEAVPLAVNPSLLGTGINIKLLESMALGVAGVTTRTGARGFEDPEAAGLAVVPDDDPAAFAAAIVALAGDPERRAAAGARAHATAIAWNEAQRAALDSVLKRAGTAKTMGGTAETAAGASS